LTVAGWLAAAIDWAWQNNRSDVISMSWRMMVGHSTISTAINNAVTQGRNGKGCILVASTGNENLEFIEFPASNANTIAVGATSMCEERKSPSSCDGEDWWGSNYGQQLDVVAPDVKIATTDITGTEGYSGWDYFPEESKIDDEYIYFNGTSSEVPHVAGIAGLIFSFSSELTQAQVREIIEITTDKIGDYSYTTTQGKPQ
jgi:subtilisin family serine protease